MTPAGTTSFVSESYGEPAPDRYINKTSGISEKLEFGDNLIADRGFNISDLFGNKGSKLIISPFLRDKNTFSKQNF